MKRRGMLFCLVGPAGGGKTTLASRLVQTNSGDLRLSVSVTSRQPRPGEQEGRSYFFVSRDEFARRIGQGEFFEWEETHGNYYGTPNAILTETLHAGVDLLLDVDIRGALNFKGRFPDDTVISFLLPPCGDVLRRRMTSRAQIGEAELTTRLETARSEYACLLELARSEVRKIDYVVINDDLEHAYNQVAAILQAERARLLRLHLEDLKRVCRID